MNRTVKIAVGSIVVGIVVLGLKTLAWRVTGSVALLSDALESTVNVATALAALIAAADQQHELHAIAARAQRYWLADPRYAAGLIIIPLMAVLLWFTGGMAGEGGPGLGLLLILGPITAWSLAYSISADIAYDHTAFHLHVVSGVRGVDDRWGRVLGLAGWGVPMILLVTTATVAAAGDWSLLAPMLGLALGLFGTTAGLSAFVSARFVYPVPKPGDSPFATPQGAAMRTMLVQGAAMLVSLALAVPFLVPFVVRLVTGAAVWGWVTVALGLAWGAVALWLGVRLGARWYDRAQAETYQAVAAF